MASPPAVATVPVAAGGSHAGLPEGVLRAVWQDGAKGNAMRVLLVEDEDSIARPLRRALEREGYIVSACQTGHAALKIARSWEPDLVLLDLLLPDLDGRDVAREIRGRSETPIIMVTARSDESERVAGLEIGADDYVVKPFSLPELMARIRAVLRRASSRERSDDELTFKDLRLDLSAYRAFQGDRRLDLTAKEFEVLRLLMRSPGTLIRRGEVARAVWNMSLAESGKTIDVHLSSLRRKLGDDAREPRYVQTVRGLGYRLAADEGPRER
jgi:DNA-binding response OmpR family regulator